MRRYELRHLQAFLALADTLHFRRAAERLHVSQPALSRTIRQLESALGLRLVARDSRNVTLTAPGDELRNLGRKVLEQLDESERMARMAEHGQVGRLVIGYIDFAFGGHLPAALQRYRQANPYVQIELVRVGTDQQRDSLVSGEGIDVGFVLGRFSAPDIECCVSTRLRSVAVLPSEHRLAGRRAINLRELLAEPMVIGSAHEWAAFRRILVDNALRLGLRPNIVQEAPSSEVIFALVAAGIGVSVYAVSETPLVRSGVTVARLGGMRGDIDVYAAWNSRRLSPAARRFVEEVIRQ